MMRFARVGLLLFFIVSIDLFGQGASSFKDLRPRQQALVRQWAQEYQKILKRPVDPEKAFNNLTTSARTTFDAVTHALQSTSLTSPSNQPLGDALDLVEGVESVNGKIENARGDHQFRIYVKLKPKALKILYESQQFVRTRDNSIYHIGYPINFRLQGGDPSIQFSVARTGRRADIDVDYRSSRGPKALVNGHLTSANSDVRAGSNFAGHVGRWNGLADWWRSLFEPRGANSPTLAAQITQLEALSDIKETPPAIEDAVHDFYQTWLIDRAPMEAVKYFSIRSFACISEFDHSLSVDSSLVRVRIFAALNEGNNRLGQVQNLTQVLQPVPLNAPNSKPTPNKRANEFALEQLRDDAVAGIDCRNRYKVALAERLEEPDGDYEGQYAATVRLRQANGETMFFTQVWQKEEGHWRILSWSLEDPFKNHPEALPQILPKSKAKGDTDSPPAGLTNATADFLNTWFVKKDYRAAQSYLSSESDACMIPLRDAHQARNPEELMKLVATHADHGNTLQAKLERVEFGHEGLTGLKHPLRDTYVIARMSDELGVMNACSDDGQLRRVSETTTSSKPTYAAGYYMVAFSLRSAVGQGATIKLIWAQRGADWKIVSYTELAD